MEWKYAGEAAYKARDHYVGMVGENNGTLKNITLRDPDVQINAEVRSAGGQNADTAMAMDANGTQYLQALADTDPDYRTEIWSVGALAGVDTGSLTNCTVDRSSRRGAEAKVTAVAKSGKHPYHLIKTTGSSSTVYGWVDAADVKEVVPAIVKGSRVKVAKGAKTYNGGSLASYVYTTTYTVIQIDGSRVVIGINGVVTAAVNIKDLTLVG